MTAAPKRADYARLEPLAQGGYTACWAYRLRTGTQAERLADALAPSFWPITGASGPQPGDRIYVIEADDAGGVARAADLIVVRHQRRDGGGHEAVVAEMAPRWSR